MEEIQIFQFAVLQVKRNRKVSFIPYCLEMRVCRYKAGDAVAQSYFSTTSHILLLTYLPVCDFCFAQIHLTKGYPCVTTLTW